MNSLLNSAMERFDALPLGPIELMVLAALITVSLCYLFSKGNAPLPPTKETTSVSRSINSTNVGKQQRGLDTNDSTLPAADRDMTEQGHIHLTDNSEPTSAAPSLPDDDDYDEQEDKSVPDFLSDASSTTTDSDTTAVGTTEQLSSKQHAVMDDNADLLDDPASNKDMEPTKHANNDHDNADAAVSRNIKTTTTTTTQSVEHEGSDDKMTCNRNDNTNDSTPTTGGGDDALSLDDEPMVISSSTQQTALQSVTENLDGAETEDPLFDMNKTNDVCNQAVIPNGATTTVVVDIGEKIDSSLLDTKEEDVATITSTVDDMVETMVKENDKALLTLQEEEEASVSQRLHNDHDGTVTADNEPATTTTTTTTQHDDNLITTADPIPEDDSHDATTVPDVKNSGGDTDPCDHHGLNTASTESTTTTIMPDANEGVPMMMMTTTRSVQIGLDVEKQAQLSMVTEDDNGVNLAADELVSENTTAAISPSVVEEEPIAHPDENQLENKVITATQQLTLSVDQDKHHGDDETMMTVGQEQQQCSMEETTNKAITTTTTTITVEENDVPLTMNTSMVDDMGASVSPYSATTMHHPNPTNKPKQDMSRIERIGQQRQPYIPLYKSRCTFWPGCTNNHCKYYHPFIECRNGPTCEFGKKCVFLHPKDYNDYQKHHASRKTKSNGKQQKKPVTRREDVPKTQQQVS